MKNINKNMIKNIALVSIAAVLILSIPALTMAFDFNAGSWMEKTGLAQQTDEQVAGTVITIINIVLGLLALIAVVLIIYAGFSYMFSRGDVEKVKKAKGIILTSAIGLIIIMAGYGIATYVFTTLNETTGWNKDYGESPQGSGDYPLCDAAGGQCELTSPSMECDRIGRDKYDEDNWDDLGRKDCMFGTCCGPED